MRMVTKCQFMDIVSGEEIGLYECRLTGDEYLATSGWSLFRVRRGEG